VDNAPSIRSSSAVGQTTVSIHVGPTISPGSQNNSSSTVFIGSSAAQATVSVSVEPTSSPSNQNKPPSPVLISSSTAAQAMVSVLVESPNSAPSQNLAPPPQQTTLVEPSNIATSQNLASPSQQTTLAAAAVQTSVLTLNALINLPATQNNRSTTTPTIDTPALSTPALEVTSPTTSTAFPIEVGSNTITLTSASEHIMSGQTLAPISPITIGSETSKLTVALQSSSSQTAPVANSNMPMFPGLPSVTSGINLGPLTLNGQRVTANAASQYIISGQTLAPGSTIVLGSSNSRITIALQTSGSYVALVFDGSTSNIQRTLPIATGLPILTVDGLTIIPNSGSQYVVASQTLLPGESMVTVPGTTLSLASAASAIVVNGVTSTLAAQIIISPPIITLSTFLITASPQTDYVINGQTLSANGPAVIAAGTTLSLALSASAIVVDGVTSVLSSQIFTITSPPKLIIGSSTVTPNSDLVYVINGQTLSAGGPAITAAGTTLSLAPSASIIVVDGVTSVLNSQISTVTSPPRLIIGSSTITPNSDLVYVINGQTLSPSGSPVTVGGHHLSLAPYASAIVVDGVTSKFAPEISIITPQPALTIDSTIATAIYQPLYLIGGQTLTAGGPALTVSGTTISLNPSASAIIVNGVTSTLTRKAAMETSPPLLTIGMMTLTATFQSLYTLTGHTIISGGTEITGSGTPMWLAHSASPVVVGGSTYALTTDLIISTSATPGLGGYIISGIGGAPSTAPAPAPSTTTASTTSIGTGVTTTTGASGLQFFTGAAVPGLGDCSGRAWAFGVGIAVALSLTI